MLAQIDDLANPQAAIRQYCDNYMIYLTIPFKHLLSESINVSRFQIVGVCLVCLDFDPVFTAHSQLSLVADFDELTIEANKRADIQVNCGRHAFDVIDHV